MSDISTTSNTTTTTTNSNGNFSGGLPTTSATNPGYVGRSSPSTYDPGQPNNPSFTGRNSNPNYGGAPTFNPTTITRGSGSSSGSGRTNTITVDIPTMTVDEVYGKTPTSKTTSTGFDTALDEAFNVTSSNQPSVEKQGDYAASSNEKSKVETSTFGKQDEISVTPELITENKGEVGNDTIQSVEGLDFQQKDKESQAVLDSKKSRDEVEAEEKAGNMRDKLRNLNKTETETDAEADFRIGESDAEKDFNEEDAAKQKELKKLEQEYIKAEKESEELEEQLKHYNEMYDKTTEDQLIFDKKVIDAIEKMDSIDEKYENLGDKLKNGEISSEEYLKSYEDKNNELKKVAEDLGFDIRNAEIGPGKEYHDYEDYIIKRIDFERKAYEDKLQVLSEQTINDIAKKSYDAKIKAGKAKQKYNTESKNYDTWKEEAWKTVENANTEPEITTATEEVVPENTTTTSFEETKKVILESSAPEEVKEEAIQTITNVQESQNEVIYAAAELPKDIENATPEQIETFIKANEKYLGYLKEANSKGIVFANTNFNTEYTTEIAKANDFNITLSDGSTMSYADFSATMATKSPQIAAAMYNAKAKKYEDDGKNFLANIERMKAKMAMDTLGSKFTFADDKVRNQFIQMAVTNERATYAAYNNVINDKSGEYSADDIAEAEASMKQAEMLSTAAATLKASTGLLSGSGDSVSDGVYGTTDPNKLETYQKVINVMENATKIILGAGVTPGAADAWNNLYYTAGDEVRNSKLFNTVFGFDPDGDDFNLFQEYGNNATVGLVAGLIELGTGVAMAFNPATAGFGANLISDSVSTFTNSLYGVQKDSRKSEKYTQEVLDYFKEARDIASKVGDEEVLKELDTAIPKIEGSAVTEEVTPAESEDTVTVTENFELGQDEVNDFNNWVEGSGSNTAENDKFNQSLTYDEWLKLIEADPTMREYAKNLLKDKPAEEKAESENEAETDAKKADAE